MSHQVVSMKIKLLSRSFLSCCAALLFLTPVALAHAQEFSKIGYVSIERILRDSAPAKAAQAKLESEFSKRGKDLQDAAARIKPLYEKLEKDGAVMTESERMRRQREIADQEKDFQRRQREFQEDLTQRRNEELSAIVNRANQVIKQIAEAEKYDLVFQEAVFVSPRIDLTEKVLRVLNGTK